MQSFNRVISDISEGDTFFYENEKDSYASEVRNDSRISKIKMTSIDQFMIQVNESRPV